jgi:hypothetical protein
MAKIYADNVEYIPGGATLNAIKLAQVLIYWLKLLLSQILMSRTTVTVDEINITLYLFF